MPNAKSLSVTMASAPGESDRVVLLLLADLSREILVGTSPDATVSTVRRLGSIW